MLVSEALRSIDSSCSDYGVQHLFLFVCFFFKKSIKIIFKKNIWLFIGLMGWVYKQQVNFSYPLSAKGGGCSIILLTEESSLQYSCTLCTSWMVLYMCFNVLKYADFMLWPSYRIPDVCLTSYLGGVRERFPSGQVAKPTQIDCFVHTNL